MQHSKQGKLNAHYGAPVSFEDPARFPSGYRSLLEEMLAKRPGARPDSMRSVGVKLESLADAGELQSTLGRMIDADADTDAVCHLPTVGASESQRPQAKALWRWGVGGLCVAALALVMLVGLPLAGALPGFQPMKELPLADAEIVYQETKEASWNALADGSVDAGSIGGATYFALDRVDEQNYDLAASFEMKKLDRTGRFRFGLFLGTSMRHGTGRLSTQVIDVYYRRPLEKNEKYQWMVDWQSRGLSFSFRKLWSGGNAAGRRPVAASGVAGSRPRWSLGRDSLERRDDTPRQGRIYSAPGSRRTACQRQCRGRRGPRSNQGIERFSQVVVVHADVSLQGPLAVSSHNSTKIARDGFGRRKPYRTWNESAAHASKRQRQKAPASRSPPGPAFADAQGPHLGHTENAYTSRQLIPQQIITRHNGGVLQGLLKESRSIQFSSVPRAGVDATDGRNMRN